MPDYACARCRRFLYRTGRPDGGFAPTRAPGALRQEKGRLYLACVECGARIPVRADPPGGKFVKPVQGVIRLERRGPA